MKTLSYIDRKHWIQINKFITNIVDFGIVTLNSIRTPDMLIKFHSVSTNRKTDMFNFL